MEQLADTSELSRAPVSAPAAGNWSWEGNVQSNAVRRLVGEGWSIVRVADTASREHGFDVEAQQNGARLLVEVKGYASDTCRNGKAAGKRRRYNSATQARTYFGNALLAGLLMRSEQPEALVVRAFPRFPTCEALALRTAGPLNAAGVVIWLVTESGNVTLVGLPS